jgi:hypothetical protein
MFLSIFLIASLTFYKLSLLVVVSYKKRQRQVWFTCDIYAGFVIAELSNF